MTSETISHWDDDLLDRRSDAQFLYNFLVGQVSKRNQQGKTSSYVINIDADWGDGKTFFLERFAKDIEERGHLVVQVNAWKDDHAQDPYIAIMAAIDRTLQPYLSKPGNFKKAWQATKTSGGPIALRTGAVIGKGLLKKFSGVSIDEIAEAITDDDTIAQALEDGAKAGGDQLEKLFDAALESLIKGFSQTDAAIQDFKTNLGKVLTSLPDDKKSPLFILIDELDRCRPTYAVQLLERVKHLFEVSNVVFVLGTNSSQLQHSISGAYGSGFDGYRYLKRFFDRTYVFEKPSTRTFIESLCVNLPAGKIRAPENELAEVLTLGCEAYEFDLRAINHIMDMIDATATAWPHDQPIEIALLFPLCAHFYRTGKAEWPPIDTDGLKKWTLKRIGKQRYNSEIIDRSIILGTVYSSCLSTIKNFSNAIKMSRQSSTDNYAYETFRMEWDGRGMLENTASIQTDLLGMVANAGKMKDQADN
ncbi:KAP family P-loop NTPase fold protein [Agrobacterium vitis]